MIVKATNSQMLKLAEAGVMFFRLFPGCYKITSGSTAQLREVGLAVRSKP